MHNLPRCPESSSELAYGDRDLYVCPECDHDCAKDPCVGRDNDYLECIDANGKLLHNRDSIVATRDLKIKGTSSVIKLGTRFKNILLNKSDHRTDCKFSGIGSMLLLSKIVKK